MTVSDQERIEAELAEARAAKAAADRRVLELLELNREMRPVWNRLRRRHRQNSFGEDFELAMTRRV